MEERRSSWPRFLLRPRIQGRELTLQDYGIVPLEGIRFSVSQEPGFRVKISPCLECILSALNFTYNIVFLMEVEGSVM